MINLTERQLKYLSSSKFDNENFITDRRLLNTLERLGHVKLDSQTGQKSTAWYIDELITTNLEIKGLGKFKQIYLSGCFKPYLMFQKY